MAEGIPEFKKFKKESRLFAFLKISSLTKNSFNFFPIVRAIKALILIFMSFTGSIGNGIGMGIIAYSIIKLCTGKGKDVSILTYFLGALFIAKFFIIF